MVFQNYGLLPWRTVLGNVEFALEVRGYRKKQRRALAHEQIEKLGLHGFEAHYPHQISGGMQQRVGIARALTKDPKILLMDEPFAAVDMQTREYLQDELLGIWRRIGTTILFVTHSIEEAVYLSDRVLVMGSGPGRVTADVPVDIARPRTIADTKSSTEYLQLIRYLRSELGGGTPRGSNSEDDGNSLETQHEIQSGHG
jgi:NitT/TauT family transport system ATP-binding protein